MAKHNPQTSTQVSSSDSRTPGVKNVAIESIVKDGQVIPDPDKVNPPLEIGQKQK